MNLKQNIKQQMGKLATVKANKRKLMRKEHRELDEINLHLGKIIWDFQMELWTTDWDAIPDNEDYNIFLKFNDIWLMFCDNWNKQKHLLKANENAFNEWAIDNTKLNQDDKPVNFIGDKFTYVCWIV